MDRLRALAPRAVRGAVTRLRRVVPIPLRRGGGARAPARVATVVAVGMLAAGAALSLSPPSRGPLGPGHVSVRARVGPPQTQVQIPPLGLVSASTHRAPLTFQARVDELDVDGIQRILERGDPLDRLERDVGTDIAPLVRGYALRALATTLLAGTLAGAVLPRRRWSFPAWGAAGAVLLTAALLGSSWLSYDPDAFREPRFEGPLERAPSILQAAQKHVRDIDDVRARISSLADSVADLYAASSLQAGGRFPEETRILHVSDVHSNPVGVELVGRLARSFGVSAVLDTGDLTSFGLAAESRIGELIGSVPAPYLFVPGNHDSEENRLALARVANVRLLDGEVVHVGPLRVLGVGDPTFTASGEVSTEEAREQKRGEVSGVHRLVAELRPHVLAVHDPELAGDVRELRSAAGITAAEPIVVATGHLHRRSFRLAEGVVTVGVGSTGATGLESFTVDAERAYEAELLTFSGTRLVAVDYISIDGLGGDFRLERRLVDPPPSVRASAVLRRTWGDKPARVS